GQRHRGRVRRMERPGCSIPDAAETARVREALLHPRSRRPSDRGGANHGPSGGLVARSLAIAHTRPGVWVNAGMDQSAYFSTRAPTRGSAAVTCRAALSRTAPYALMITGRLEAAPRLSVTESNACVTSSPCCAR